jgi:tetratricopeptide (TPR) repeat protein
MRSRDGLLAALSEQVTKATKGAAFEAVLTDQALSDAEELKNLIDPDSDLDAALVIGMVHWYRYLAASTDVRQDELAAAARFFAPVYVANPRVALEQLRRLDLRSHDQREVADVTTATRQAADLLTAYGQTGEVGLLGHAVALLQLAVMVLPPGHPDRASGLHNLSTSLGALAGSTGNLALLEEAMRAGQDALQAVPADHPLVTAFAENLGVISGTLRVLAERSGNLAVLKQSIQADRAVIAATQVGDPGRPRRLVNLAGALRTLGERTGNAAALDEAERATKGALLEMVTAAWRTKVAAIGLDDTLRADYLFELCIGLRLLFDHSGEISVLREAVRLEREAIAATAADHPDRAAYLACLRDCLKDLHERTGDTSLLAEIATVERQAAAADTPPAHPQLGSALRAFGRAYLEFGQRTADTGVIEQAVRMLREARAVTATSASSHAAVLILLGSALMELGERTDNLAAIEEAVQVRRDAIGVVPPDDPAHAYCLSLLGIDLEALGGRTGNVAILGQAVRARRAAAAATPVDDPMRITRLSGLADVLMALAERSSDVAVVEEAVQARRAVVTAVPPEGPDYAQALNLLSVALQVLGERTGDTAAIEQAVHAGQAAVTAAPADDPASGHLQALCRNQLVVALHALYRHTGDGALLEESVRAVKSALDAAPAEGPERAVIGTEYGRALHLLARHTEDVASLEEAVRTLRLAVTQTPSHERAAALIELSTALVSLYGLTGRSEQLEEAVETGRAAASAEPVDRQSLHVLQIALRLLFERTGDDVTLREAVRVGRQAIAAPPTPPAGSADSVALTSLATSLRLLYQFTGDTVALWEAVSVGRAAVAKLPAGDSRRSDRAGPLNNLGIALLELGQRTGDTGALAEAVQVHQDAVAASRPDDPGRVRRLSNLGNALRVLGTRTRNADVLTEAAQAGRDALAATPADHPSRARSFNLLAGTLLALGQSASDPEVLAEAVQAGRDAVACAPPDHAEHAMYTSNLGNYLKALFAITNDVSVMAEAGRCFAQAAENANAPVRQRLAAYLTVAALPAEAGGSPERALAALETAVSLLPKIAARTLVRADREHGLRQAATLADQAAAAAVAVGQVDRAVELLEQSRGVLLADALDARSSDLTRLRDQQPELAREFAELRSRMSALDHPDRAFDAPGDGGTAESARGQARRDLYSAWDDLVARIRAIAEFHDFLMRPEIRELAQHAENGPVVFVYASTSRCDALILTPAADHPVRLVPLPGLTYADARHNAARLVNAQQAAADDHSDSAARIASESEILDILAWLWDNVTGPILTALGHDTPPADTGRWPRVWWCPVGILSYLPLHAAGHHREVAAGRPERPAPRTALDRVTSSYTPTLRSLAYARNQRISPAASTTAIVAVPAAVGAPKLPGVMAEADLLQALIPGARIVPNPTRDSVLAAFAENRVAHLACHCQLDWNDPSSSKLVLNDYQTRPLTVGDLGRLQVDGGLAYLSACDTSVTNPELTNEAVHVTGAFHLAGFQHVIGTLWEIKDSAAKNLARDFYSLLTDHGSGHPNIDNAAEALHRAVKRLRDRRPQTPTLWAGFTHTGP